MNYTNEAWEEEQMSNLGCESVGDLIAEVKRLREQLKHLRGQLGRYTQFVLWVEEEHNEVFDEYEGKDEL